MSENTKRCKQCKGQGYLMIATPVQLPAGESFTIGLMQCYLCNDQEAWGYVLNYFNMYGTRPPKREVLALKEPGGKVLPLKVRCSPEPVDSPPNGPTIA